MIRNIINQEISNLLNETYTLTDNRLKFKQKLNNVEFNNNASITNDFDTNIPEYLLNIGWSVSLKINEMGIEEFIVEITGVEGNLKLEMRDKQSDELMREDVKDINEYNWKFKIEDDVILEKGGSLFVTSTVFDFIDETCTVKFENNN